MQIQQQRVVYDVWSSGQVSVLVWAAPAKGSLKAL